MLFLPFVWVVSGEGHLVAFFIASHSLVSRIGGLQDDLAVESMFPNQTCLERSGRRPTGWENVARTWVSLLSASFELGYLGVV